MTPIISPWIFYLISLFNNIGTISVIIAVISPIALIGATILVFCADELDNYGKSIRKGFIACIAVAVLSCAIPSKKTMYTMLVSSLVTYENVETVGNTIKDSVDYIIDKVADSEDGDS